MENESSVRKVISDSLEQIRTFIDADTVIGKQIVTPSGTVIIPISKLSMGFATGGLDLPVKSERNMIVGAGGGTGVTVSPIAFLSISSAGKVELIPITETRDTTADQILGLVEQLPDLIGRIRTVLTEKDADKNAEELEEVAHELTEKVMNSTAENAVELSEEKADEDEEEIVLTKKELRRAKKAWKKGQKDPARRGEPEGVDF